MIAVTHLITGLDVGGAESMLARLVTRSDRARFRHVVISMQKPGEIAATIQSAGVRVDSLNMTPGLPDPTAFFSLRRLLIQHQADVLQGWMYHANLLASVAGPILRTPVVWNMRAVPDVDYGRQIAAIDAVLSRTAWLPARVIINSEYGRRFMASRGYLGARWNVIPNGFDTTQFRPDADSRRQVRAEWGISENQVLVGLVARLDPVKDHPIFLEAAQLVADTNSQVRFVCVGGGEQAYLDQLRSLSERLGIADRVVWAGTRRDIPQVNSALDIASCSSMSESFPNVVGEAMACGVPCVVTDVGDSSHLVGDTGAIVPPRSPAALASAWQDMISGGPMYRSHLGAQARERIVSDFSLDRIVRDYEDLYSTVARKA